MNFGQRLKQDKGFRWKVFIIGIIIFIMFSNIENKKIATAEECNLYNTRGVIITTGQYQSCKSAGCVPAFKYELSGIVGTFDSWADWLINQIGLQSDVVACKPFASAGQYIEASSLTEAKSMCESGRAILVKDNWFGKDIYGCKSDDSNNGDSSCTSTQREIGGILDSLWPTNDLSCKTKFYTVSIIGGLIGMMLFMAAI